MARSWSCARRSAQPALGRRRLRDFAATRSRRWPPRKACRSIPPASPRITSSASGSTRSAAAPPSSALPGAPGRPLVATRAYFPATLTPRSPEGALDDRHRAGRLGSARLERRRRRALDAAARPPSPLAALVLCAAYAALVLWAGLFAAEALNGRAMRPLPDFLALLLTINGGLLLWRLAMRFGFVTRSYGWREGLRAMPAHRDRQSDRDAGGPARARPLSRHPRTGAWRWDKTAHAFPRHVPAE